MGLRSLLVLTGLVLVQSYAPEQVLNGYIGGTEAFQGYSVIDANPLAGAGFKSAIFEMKDGPAITKQDLNYCTNGYTSLVRSGTSGYVDELSQSVSFDASGWGAKFSASVGYKTVKSEEKSHGIKTVTTKASCLDYRTTMNVYATPPLASPFSDYIRNKLQSTPWSQLSDSGKWDYHEFLDVFGTHYPAVVTFGAMASSTSTITDEAYEMFQKEEIDVEVAASYSSFGASASVHSETHKQREDRETFEQHSNSVQTVIRGASQNSGAVDELVPKDGNPNPQPVDLSLQTMWDLVRNHPGITVDSTVVDNIQWALLTYCDEYRNQGHGRGGGVESCEAYNTGFCSWHVGFGDSSGELGCWDTDSYYDCALKVREEAPTANAASYKFKDAGPGQVVGTCCALYQMRGNFHSSTWKSCFLKP